MGVLCFEGFRCRCSEEHLRLFTHLNVLGCIEILADHLKVLTHSAKAMKDFFTFATKTRIKLPTLLASQTHLLNYKYGLKCPLDIKMAAR